MVSMSEFSQNELLFCLDKIIVSCYSYPTFSLHKYLE